MKIFIRSPRGWLQELAKSLDVAYSKKTNNMFEKPRSGRALLFDKILALYKSTPLPPLEWIIPYKYLVKYPADSELIIEGGSKIINIDTPYISYVESGLGLFGFNTKKINFFNQWIFKKIIQKKALIGFVFYSDSARQSTLSIFKQLSLLDLFSELDLGVIYPFAKDGVNIALGKKHERTQLVFCSSSFNLKGGRELVIAFREIHKKYNCKLVIITDLQNIPKIYTDESIDFIDFNLSPEMYRSILLESDVIVHPTLFDTHALSLMEGIKQGLPCITTNTFALAEYVDNNVTGIVLSNPFPPYSESKGPNFRGEPLKHARKIMNNKAVSKILVENLIESIETLIVNYDKFEKNTAEYIKTHDFSEKNVRLAWKKIFSEVKLK